MMKKIALGFICCSFTCVIFADDTQPNYWSGDVLMGLSWGSLSNTDTLQMSPEIDNQYATDSTSSAVPLVGLGLAYNILYRNVDFGLGLSTYYLHDTNASGVATPGINAGSTDALNYSASGNSAALMFEPKFTLDQYAWQPYVLMGMGMAFNHFSDYSESPTDLSPFNSLTQIAFAYELGIGVQYVFTIQSYMPIVALDYRYMNWGNAGMAPFTSQQTNNDLNFGDLKTNSLNLSLILPF